MEGYGLDTFGGYINPALDFIRAGFNQVNAAQGLLIALVAVFVMTKWKQLIPVAGAATIVYTIIDVLLPVVTSQAALRLPDILGLEFWQKLAGTFIGLMIVISMFFAVKRVFFKPGGS